MFVDLRRILFPTDFSEPARQAQQYATALAERFQCELHLLHIVPQLTLPLPEASTSWTLPEADQRLQVEEAQRQLIDDVKSSGLKQLDTVQVVKVGYAVEEIVNYAKDHDIDLIVIGTHGHTGFAHLLMGSVAEKIVRLATCPVLTVHPKGHQFVSESANRSTFAGTM